MSKALRAGGWKTSAAPRANVIETGKEFHTDTARQLFPAVAVVGEWDVTADGKCFLVDVPQPNFETSISVILNWQTILNKRAHLDR